MASKRQTDPLTLRLWALLRDRGEADRRLVFNALQRRLSSGPDTEKQEIALYALRRWMSIHDADRPPSRRQYDAFREQQAEPRQWPSATLIRNAFSGWTQACAAAEGDPVPDPTARRLTSLGSRFERQEIERALRAWVEGVPAEHPLLQDDFLAWCRERLDGSDPDFKRLPRTDNTIRVVFGGWAEALAAIGELQRQHRLVAARSGNSTALCDAIRDRLASAPPAGTGIYSRQALIAWLKWSAECLPQRRKPFTARAYDDLRGTAQQVAADQGAVLRMPSSITLIERLGGSWPKALCNAGLLSPSKARLKPDRRPYATKELSEAVRHAAEATEGKLDQPAYKRWRREELAARRKGDARARVPSALVLRQRLGGPKRQWSEVLRAALSGSDSQATGQRNRARQGGQAKRRGSEGKG